MLGRMTGSRPWEALDALPAYVELRARSYRPFLPADGVPVVDVGCGSGLAVREMTARGIAAVGVDPDPALGARVGSAQRLPFRDGTLGGYRAERVYHLFAEPAAALAEARRVLRPGAPLILLTQDWAMTVAHDVPPATLRFVEETAARVPAPAAGRASYAAVRAAGFRDVAVEVVTAVVFPGERGMLVVPTFVVSARAPAPTRR